MVKRAFNILVEEEFLDILEAFRRYNHLATKTAAFQSAMNEILANLNEALYPHLKLIHAEKELQRKCQPKKTEN
jgi:hypothetical protein